MIVVASIMLLFGAGGVVGASQSTNAKSWVRNFYRLIANDRRMFFGPENCLTLEKRNNVGDRMPTGTAKSRRTQRIDLGSRLVWVADTGQSAGHRARRSRKGLCARGSLSATSTDHRCSLIGTERNSAWTDALRLLVGLMATSPCQTSMGHRYCWFSSGSVNNSFWIMRSGLSG